MVMVSPLREPENTYRQQFDAEEMYIENRLNDSQLEPLYPINRLDHDTELEPSRSMANSL